MDELISFLRRMLDEDERRARACAEVYPAPWDVSDRGHTAYVRADAPGFRIVAELEQDDGIYDWLSVRLDHIARHDPARVLADVAAKRMVLADLDTAIQASKDHPEDMANKGWVLAVVRQIHRLATAYADHADYRAEWRP